MSQKMILYNLDVSPPVRTVKVVAKLLDIELKIRDLDLFNAEHLDDKYLKLNPEHTVPTLVDGDFAIWDSHTICAYLVDKYGKDDKLYPKDLKLRAKCNQRLFFDAASLFVRLRDCSLMVFTRGAAEIPSEKIEPIHSAYDTLEKFLDTDLYLVGNQPTIADISVANTVLPLEIYAPLKPKNHKNILAWLKRVKENVPHFDEVNGNQVEAYRQKIQSTLEQNKRNPF